MIIDGKDRPITHWGRSHSWCFVEDMAVGLRAAADLLALMTELAEEAYCESWSSGTSPGLWRCVLNPDAQPEERDGWGYDQTDRASAHRLVELCREAGCWWTWSTEHEDVQMVPLLEWADLHGRPAWLPAGERTGL